MDHVDGNAMQPRPERALPSEAPKASPNTHEDLLRDVLGVGTAVRQRAREADDRRLMAADQLVKRLATARGSPFDQLAVGIHSAVFPSRRQAGGHKFGPACGGLYSQQPVDHPQEYSVTVGGPSLHKLTKETLPMTTRIRTLSTIVAAALVLGAGISTVAGQGRPGDAGQGRGFGGPGRGPGFGGPLPLLRQLDLTDTQRDQIKAVTDAQRNQANQAPVRKLMELHRSLEAALFADNPDTAQIDQLRASISEAEAAALAARIDLQLKIAQILTAEQRQKARELVAQRPNSQARFNFGGPRRDRRALPAGQE
jgi:Spy/CpxP family protein refolding chaperone